MNEHKVCDTDEVLNFDVIIIGAGMVGATLAAMLASGAQTKDLNIAIVDAADEPRTFSGEVFDARVVALSKQSENIFRELEIWQTITAERACPYYAMDVWDAEGTGNIQFHAEDIHADNLGHIIENSLVVRALQHKLQCFKSLDYFKHYRVKEYIAAPENTVIVERCEKSTDKNKAHSHSISLKGAILVAADGAHSKLRELAGLKTREWTYGHTAIVSTVKTQLPHRHSCWQRFTQRGPIAFLPLQQGAQKQSDDQHYCSLVWSAESSLAEELMALSDQDFCTKLAQQFEFRLGGVESCAKRHAIPLRQRHAVNYICEGMALVGDAAHTIHPLAGQGVNLGLYDVKVLAAEIARACERGVHLSDASLLRRYQRERKTHNLSAMITMEGFKRLFAADMPAIRWARNTGMSLINSQLYLKKHLAKVAAGQL
ncbi:2-octaprenylphenol hydroxylase [Alteromonadaceae bacterium Bs31]|nr:2-octaprenylphenol hydroxylase [Alteromonadaceae bacterium Bs31]